MSNKNEYLSKRLKILEIGRCSRQGVIYKFSIIFEIIDNLFEIIIVIIEICHARAFS